MDGGGVMVWAGIGYHGKTDSVFIDNRVNSQDHVQLCSPLEGLTREARMRFPTHCLPRRETVSDSLGMQRSLKSRQLQKKRKLYS